ncbi:aprataxin and PNK-like factor isoform X3 [Heliangelus exortis]|uniref:aprataxin and PNK-like factor isoform X3 n=1 Tax=Heliangelus exortis TaxID=472823 RepID=UPI003A937AA2
MRKNCTTSRHLVLPSDGNESEQSKSIQRKRVLPSWMLEKDLLVERISEPVVKGGSRMKKVQGRGESNMESLKSEVSVRQKKRLASGEAIEDFEGEEQDQGKRSCLSIPVPSSQNASGFPLENTMRNMEGNGKTGTKNPGSSLERNDRELHSKLSKRIGQISSKANVIEETESKEQITGSTSQQAHWGRTSQNFAAQEGTLESDANLDYKTEISADASEGSKQIKHKRTPCMYGTGCYREKDSSQPPPAPTWGPSHERESFTNPSWAAHRVTAASGAVTSSGTGSSRQQVHLCSPWATGEPLLRHLFPLPH